MIPPYQSGENPWNLFCRFFTPTTVEMVVKVLQGCSLTEYFWVYAGGLTGVEVV